MAGTTIQAPGLSTYLKSLKSTPVDASVEHFISWGFTSNTIAQLD